MTDTADYHWRLIERAAGADITTDLRHWPYLDAALRFAGYTLPPDTPPQMIRAVCNGALQRRLAETGLGD